MWTKYLCEYIVLFVFSIFLSIIKLLLSVHSIRIRRLIQSCRRCVYGGDQRGKTLYWTTRARDIILLVMMLLLIVLVIVMYDNIILGTETCEMDNVFPPDDL